MIANRRVGDCGVRVRQYFKLCSPVSISALHSPSTRRGAKVRLRPTGWLSCE